MPDTTAKLITEPDEDAETDLVETAAQGFAERYRAAPDGVWSAPGRVNLIGEHTDYNQGYVLPFAIDRRTAAAVGLCSERVVRVASSFFADQITIPLDDISPESIAGWSAYALGVVWALTRQNHLREFPGVQIFLDSHVPVGAGLSSSAALESATAVALNELWQLGSSRANLARAGHRAENAVVGAPTGIMDQFASMLGEADSAVFLDCRDESAEIVPLRLQQAGVAVVAIDTKRRHSHATGGYAARRASCDRAADLLGVTALRDVGLDDLDRAAATLDEETFRRVRHVVTDSDRVLQTVATLASAGPTAIGPLLDASHRSAREDFEISTPALDLAVHAARQAGAIGARMTGGGFGGCAIALIHNPDMPVVTTAIREAFADAEFDYPGIFTVTPSGGARRDR